MQLKVSVSEDVSIYCCFLMLTVLFPQTSHSSAWSEFLIWTVYPTYVYWLYTRQWAGLLSAACHPIMHYSKLRSSAHRQVDAQASER